jgi:hypothetical protein
LGEGIREDRGRKRKEGGGKRGRGEVGGDRRRDDGEVEVEQGEEHTT